MRIAFVVQRYGLEICGGAELHCRWVAEHLTPYCSVDVITTCALEHNPWDNYYPEGETVVNGVRVHRFPVERTREHRAFDDLSRRVFGESHSYLDELEWIEMLGPYAPGLLRFLARTQLDYDLFIFFTYQYFTTVFGLPIVAARAALVPTAHDEPGIYLDVYNPVFHLPRFIIYNTDTERSTVEWRFDNGRIPNTVVGTGIEFDGNADAERFRQQRGIADPIILYIGRVEHAKGCPTLFDYFTRYKAERGGPLRLALAGKSGMPIPKRPDVVSLGFVSETEKFDAIAAAELVVLPSEHESLSMANLEAWLLGRPVLANGLCQVLKDNCVKSNGGLYYTSYPEFAACLDLLLGDPDLRRALGERGRRYYEAHYSWTSIEAKYLALLAETTGVC